MSGMFSLFGIWKDIDDAKRGIVNKDIILIDASGGILNIKVGY